MNQKNPRAAHPSATGAPLPSAPQGRHTKARGASPSTQAPRTTQPRRGGIRKRGAPAPRPKLPEPPSPAGATYESEGLQPLDPSTSNHPAPQGRHTKARGASPSTQAPRTTQPRRGGIRKRGAPTPRPKLRSPSRALKGRHKATPIRRTPSASPRSINALRVPARRAENSPAFQRRVCFHPSRFFSPPCQGGVGEVNRTNPRAARSINPLPLGAGRVREDRHPAPKR